MHSELRHGGHGMVQGSRLCKTGLIGAMRTARRFPTCTFPTLRTNLTRTASECVFAMPPMHRDGRNATLYGPLKRRMLENGDWDRYVLKVRRGKDKESE